MRIELFSIFSRKSSKAFPKRTPQSGDRGSNMLRSSPLMMSSVLGNLGVCSCTQHSPAIMFPDAKHGSYSQCPTNPCVSHCRLSYTSSHGMTSIHSTSDMWYAETRLVSFSSRLLPVSPITHGDARIGTQKDQECVCLSDGVAVSSDSSTDYPRFIPDAFRASRNHVLPLGSDFPVEGVNPLLGFYAAVSRLSVTGTSPHGEGGW